MGYDRDQENDYYQNSVTFHNINQPTFEFHRHTTPQLHVLDAHTLKALSL